MGVMLIVLLYQAEAGLWDKDDFYFVCVTDLLQV